MWGKKADVQRKNFKRPSDSLENYHLRPLKNYKEVWLLGSKVQRNERRLTEQRRYVGRKQRVKAKLKI